MPFKATVDQLPGYAHDIKLNLQEVLTEKGAPGLKLNQIYGVALAVVYAIRNEELIAFFEKEAATKLSAAEINAAKGSATIMAMNNLYYHSLHMNKDPELRELPVNLYMQFIAKSGIARSDFTLYSLAVSAVNGCAPCLIGHSNDATKHGLSKLGLQSILRIAAVMKALAQVLTIEATQHE